MKRVVLITDGWRKYVTYSWCHGVMEEARQRGVDIILTTFNSNGNLSHDKKHNMGEYSLYTLPDLRGADGVIFDCTNIGNKEVIERTVAAIRRAEVPVVSISTYIEGFYYVGVDNKSMFRQIMDHLYYNHGCRNIVFAGGPKFSYENQMRFEAYCEALQDYGISVSNDNCLFGDFDYDTGVKYMREWLNSDKKLPDAFACANDNIAAGLCSEAEKRGLSVPGYFKVTGYDNFDKVAYYKPQITTVDYNRNDIGRKAFEIINRVWNGEEVDTYNYLQTSFIPAESCGCPNNGRVDYRYFAKNQIDRSVSMDKHEEAIMDLEGRMAECRTFPSLFEVYGRFISELDCDGCFISVDKRLLDANFDTQFAKACFNYDHLMNVYAENHGRRIYNLTTFNEYLAFLENVKQSQHYIFFPLHFRDEIIGTTMIVNPRFLEINSSFYDINNAFLLKLDNLYRHLQIENASKRMQELFNKDPLTHLYNRLAYSHMIRARFDEFVKLKVSCALVFFDVDRFKEINDTMGHDFGDRVLVAISDTIRHFKPLDALAYRFGGDEFVVFIPYAFESKINRFTNNTISFLEKMGIYISCGVITTDSEADISLDDYIAMADKKMYAEKHLRKSKQRRQILKNLRVTKPLIPEGKLFDDRIFLKGIDISGMLARERAGVSFYDYDGKKMDPFTFFKDNNLNAIRIRMGVNPNIDIDDTRGGCNLEDTLEMAGRIKAAGMKFILDIQYSDKGAYSSRQVKPREWERLSFDELVDKVYEYTRSVLNSLSAIDALPDIVQIGNEIRTGMLFPDGALPRYDKLVRLVNSGIKAVRDVSEDIKVMIHLDHGGRFYNLKEWFDSMYGAGMEQIDCIGLSFYSFWHGNFINLKNTIEQLIKRYNLSVYIVETAHPWRHSEDGIISSHQMKNTGLSADCTQQKEALDIVMQIAAHISGDKDTGVLYFEPMTAPGMGFGVWDANMGLIGEGLKALPAWDSFKNFDPQSPPIADIDNYLNKLYEHENMQVLPSGSNLIENGDFAEGLKTWWLVKEPSDVKVEERVNEIFFQGQFNFRLQIFKEMRIEKSGKYKFVVSYMGNSAADTSIEMMVKIIDYSGEVSHTKRIIPSDIHFVNYTMDDIEIPEGQIALGIIVRSSAIYGRVVNMKLVEVVD